MIKNCIQCHKEFITWHRVQKLCSRKCRATYHKNGIYKNCIVCGTRYYVQRNRINKISKYCSRRCLAKKHLAKYVLIYGFQKTSTPPHKYKTVSIKTSNGQSKQIREHRWIMEQYLGRKLSSNEHVHHIDGNPLNNSIDNLVILTNSEHQKIELRKRKEYKHSS